MSRSFWLCPASVLFATEVVALPVIALIRYVVG